MNYEEKNKRFQKMIKDLVKVAEEDNTISRSEASYLERIELTVQEFTNEVSNSLEDGKITDGEYLRLKKIEDHFLSDVFQAIENGDNIDSDTKKLIEVVFNVLMDTL